MPSPALERHARREPSMRQPVAVEGQSGLVTVDATWGTIQPHELPGGVRTVGELEVIEHLRGGGTAVDTRQPDAVARGTLPGAVAIPHQEIAERRAPETGGPVVLFCNGPQCAATPLAVEALLAAGWPAERLRYYRGGIHDWVTLGLPLTR
jgi:rhodanese-related sulfurtransferase